MSSQWERTGWISARWEKPLLRYDVVNHMAERDYICTNPEKASRTLTNQQLCEHPYFALSYASDRLLDEDFLKCVRLEPKRAFLFVDNFTLPQFDICVRASPENALAIVPEKLNREQFDFCVRAAPEFSLRHFSEKISEIQFDYCVRAAPGDALGLVAEKLNKEQFDFCARASPGDALRDVSQMLNQDQFDFCVRAVPLEALNYVIHLLNKDQFDFCIREEPSSARACRFRNEWIMWSGLK